MNQKVKIEQYATGTVPRLVLPERAKLLGYSAVQRTAPQRQLRKDLNTGWSDFLPGLQIRLPSGKGHLRVLLERHGEGPPGTQAAARRGVCRALLPLWHLTTRTVHSQPMAADVHGLSIALLHVGITEGGV
jgi:hypothetical protein